MIVLKKVIIGSFLTIGILSLTACQTHIDSQHSYADSKEKVWVHLQLEVSSYKEPDYYYLYAQVKKNLFEDISNNTIAEGFLLIENVKFINDENLIEDYADDENQGTLVFRVEQLLNLRLLKKEPITNAGLEQFAENNETSESTD